MKTLRIAFLTHDFITARNEKSGELGSYINKIYSIKNGFTINFVLTSVIIELKSFKKPETTLVLV